MRQSAEPNAELLLTSVGPTTDVMQERLFELGRNAGQLSALNVLLVTDGWTPFTGADGMTFVERLNHRVESIFIRWWTNKYISHVLGNVAIYNLNLGAASIEMAEFIIGYSDMIIVPGGNTFQTIRGIKPHEYMIRRHVAEGKPYVSDSSGTIIAGLTTRSAALKPADAEPDTELNIEYGLGLVNFDIVTHAQGREGDFAIPGMLSKAASLVLPKYESPQSVVEDFIILRQNEGVAVETLNDNQALSITKGQVEYI
jgi:peptidase E